MNEYNTKICRNKSSSCSRNLHIVSLADVVDVSGDRGICANTIVLHQANEFSLCQIVGWACLSFCQIDRGNRQHLSLLEIRNILVCLCYPMHHRRKPRRRNLGSFAFKLFAANAEYHIGGSILQARTNGTDKGACNKIVQPPRVAA